MNLLYHKLSQDARVNNIILLYKIYFFCYNIRNDPLNAHISRFTAELIFKNYSDEKELL